MCIARVGKVLSVADSSATIRFLDGRVTDGVDISVVGAQEGAYVEVMGNFALSVLTKEQLRERKAAWALIQQAAAGARR